jgi:hypothetical protein
MYKYTIILFIILLPLVSFSQSRDQSDWIDFGSTSAAQYLQIAPGTLGPNALLVPRMDYAKVGDESELEVGCHYHQMYGDTAVNSFVRFYWNIAPGRAAVEIWGQPSETFRLINELRDERQIYYDDDGWTTIAGDLLVSTYVQILKDQRIWPDVSINYTLKTTTGDNYDGRYTNASMNYFYLAIAKSLLFDKGPVDEIRLAGMGGFYVWQTNKVMMAQDEGAVMEVGLQLRKESFNFYTEFGGYSGYDAYQFLCDQYGEKTIQGHNDPLILRMRMEKTGKHFNYSAEYQTGFRDYDYQTLRLGVTLHFAARKFK